MTELERLKCDWKDSDEPGTSSDAILTAAGLIKMFGFVEPAIGIGKSGEVYLDWCLSPNWMVSVTVTGSLEPLRYAMIFGEFEEEGSWSNDGKIPERMLLALRVFCRLTAAHHLETGE